MTPDPEQGRTVPVPVINLPELVFDLSEGHPLPSPLGKTEAPVHILPGLTFDLQPAEPTPALQLNLLVRPEATPAELALDLLRLCMTVNQLERGDRGAGLVLEEALCNATVTNGTIRVTFKPADPTGATERLTKLVQMINGESSKASAIVPRGQSIESCEARVVRVAA
jgi:hypothetical protein